MNSSILLKHVEIRKSLGEKSHSNESVIINNEKCLSHIHLQRLYKMTDMQPTWINLPPSVEFLQESSYLGDGGAHSCSHESKAHECVWGLRARDFPKGKHLNQPSYVHISEVVEAAGELTLHIMSEWINLHFRVLLWPRGAPNPQQSRTSPRSAPACLPCHPQPGETRFSFWYGNIHKWQVRKF